MERSLTVLLPVHNAQATLAATVAEVLEVVSELTGRFELVIVDDGSADATSEVADELTRRYPQVHAIRHGDCLGREAAVRTGLRHSSGDVVFVREESSGLAVDGIPRLWRAAHEHELVADRAASSSRSTWARFSAGHPARRGGYRMIDRSLMEPRHGSSRPSRPNYLAKFKDFALGE